MPPSAETLEGNTLFIGGPFRAARLVICACLAVYVASFGTNYRRLGRRAKLLADPLASGARVGGTGAVDLLTGGSSEAANKFKNT